VTNIAARVIKMYACMNKVEDVRLMESRKSARLQQDSSEFHHQQLQYVRPNVISHVSSSMTDVPESLLRNRSVMN